MEGRDHGRWGQGSGCTEKVRVDKYKPDMLISWAVTQNRNVMQGGTNWLQGLKNYFQ